MKMIEWVEPIGPNSEPVYCRISEKTAVAVQRSAALQSPKKYIYPTDDAAIEDFLVVHWAIYVDDSRENLQ
jgi:hypothetical protein